jgi:hypothetical protein
MNELTSKSSFKQAELASLYRVLSKESDMYRLLIKRVSTVTSEFLQYRIRIGLNRVSIEWVVERLVYLNSQASY